MSDQPRDQRIADEITKAEALAESLMVTMRDLVDDARKHEALGHAALYEDVRENLKAARDILSEAAEIMRTGDPEHYA